MKGKLTRIGSNHQNMRTDAAEGVFETLPTVGECFLMLGKGLTKINGKESTRMIQTSPVIEVETKGFDLYSYTWFKTKNSEYKLEVLAD